MCFEGLSELKNFEKSLKSSFKIVGRNGDKEMMANVNGIFSAFIQCQL
jgi:hypothetical protein